MIRNPGKDRSKCCCRFVSLPIPGSWHNREFIYFGFLNACLSEGAEKAMKEQSKSKGQLEATISEAIIRFEKEFMGRGPLEAKSYIIDDMVLVRLKNVLTQAELMLAEASDNTNGRELIKKTRITLLEQGRSLLESAIEQIIETKIVSLHTDISTITGERIILFSLTEPVKLGPQ